MQRTTVGRRRRSRTWVFAAVAALAVATIVVIASPKITRALDSMGGRRVTMPGASCLDSSPDASPCYAVQNAVAAPTPRVRPSASASASAHPPTTKSRTGPSGQSLPTGDLPGWHQVFTDDFTTNVPLGSFPKAVSDKWTSYDGFQDTYGNGTYSPGKVISVSGGLMNMHLHTENGVHLVAAPVPIIPGHTSAYQGLTYGRFAVRFRADHPANLAGYKTAWLLWPDSDFWPEGEIDFPEAGLNGSINAFMHHKGDPQAQETYPIRTTYGSWHTAVIEWTPQSVTFKLDNKVIGKDTHTDLLPSTPMHWVLQTETLPTGPSDTATGNVQIDWVAIWSRK
jgi:beta-glucanase (GH16 family)